jgi:hypothetical protein
MNCVQQIKKYLEEDGLHEIVNPMRQKRSDATLGDSRGISVFQTLKSLVADVIEGQRILRNLYSLHFYIRRDENLSDNKDCLALFFSVTHNQNAALRPIVKAMKGSEVSPLQLVNSRVARKESPGDVELEVSRLVKIRAASFLLLEFRALRALKAAVPMCERHHWPRFVAEFYFFFKLLASIKPEIVIFANDHSFTPRVVLLVARALKIKTAYVQHASVSNRFPALEYDYSFLDGLDSLEKYLQCEDNPGRLRLRRNERTIYLTGQLKPLPIARGRMIGIGLPLRFPIDDLQSLLGACSNSNRTIFIRSHPGEKETLLAQIKNLALESGVDVIVQHGSEGDIDSFLRQCFCLISRESSILLEGSLCDIPTVNWVKKDSSTYDYYGFIRHGLVDHIESAAEISSWISSVESGHKTGSDGAKRFFSASYGTIHMNSEARLVADIICGKLIKAHAPHYNINSYVLP